MSTMFRAISLLLALLSVVQSVCARNENDVPRDGDLDSQTKKILKELRKPDEMSDEDWERSVLVYKIQMSQNNDFDFLGVILDHEKKPVEQVEIHAEITAYDPEYILKKETWGEDQKKEKWVGFSDARGRFRILGRGTSIKINDLKKNGYITPRLRQTFSTGRQSETMIKMPVILREPESFTLWPSEYAREQNNIRKIYHRAFISADGATNHMDLITGSLTNCESNADLIFSIKSDARPEMPCGTRYDWTFRLSSTSGGVVETDRNDLYMAPASGYSDMIIDEKANPTNWQSGYSKMIFIKSHNGQSYGFAFINVGASFDGEALFSVRGFINTNGSPNLIQMDGFLQ